MARAGISSDVFGHLPTGEAVEAVTLANAGGTTVRIISYGASLQSVVVPGRDGVRADVTVGHRTLQEYLDCPQYAGATVGRVANRIAGGRFVLDGREYRVPLNNGPNALHGGERGFDKANWRIERLDERSVTFAHTSPDGDQVFPGTLSVTAEYSLDDTGRLSVEYLATTDAPTLVNLSNHAYWNLAGDGAPEGAMSHRLTIFADRYLPVDAALIPNGEFRAVAGSPFDFRSPVAIGARLRHGSDEQIRFGRGYDNNWVIGREVSDHPRPLARLEDPRSGRTMTVSSNQPGIQFYSGNFFDGSTCGKGGQLIRMGDAVALEPQAFPDTPNRPEFGSVRLDPGQTYRNVIEWAFSAGEGA